MDSNIEEKELDAGRKPMQCPLGIPWYVQALCAGLLAGSPLAVTAETAKDWVLFGIGILTGAAAYVLGKFQKPPGHDKVRA